jgi:hypothetical protein
MFCDATGKITVDGTTYSQPFTGSFSKNDLVLPIGQHIVGGAIDIQTCTAAIRNIVRPELGRVSSVYSVLNDAFSPEFSAPTSTVSIENSFVCSLYPNAPATVSAAPGDTVPFSFTLNNGGNKDLSVSSISLVGATFSNLQITSPAIPFTITAGGSRAISGSVLVPAGTPSGTYSLVLNVQSQTTAPDCTNTGLKSCNNGTTIPIRITVGPGLKPNYVPVLSGPSVAYVGTPFTVNYNTANTGNAPATASSTTRLTFTDLPLPIDTRVPPLGIGATQANSTTITCTSVGAKTLAETVDFNNEVDESNEGDNFASISVDCQPALPKPDYVVSSISNSGPTYVGETFTSIITTQNNGSAPATATSTTNATFPTGQLAQISPVPALGPGATHTGSVSLACQNSGSNTEVATANALRTVDESNYANNARTASKVCYNIPPQTGHCVLSFATRPNNTLGVPDSDLVVATCTDSSGVQTMCPNMTWTHTATGNVALIPSTTPRTEPPAKPTVTLSVGAGTPGQSNLQVNAVSSEPGVPMACAPLVFNIRSNDAYAINCRLVNHDPVFFANDSAQVRVSCWKNDDLQVCPALNWSTNLSGAILNPTYTPPGPSPVYSMFYSPLTEPTQVQTGSISISCADPMDCNATCDLALTFSPKPTNLTCGLVNHTHLFLKNDWAYVEGNCTKAGIPGLVACPRLRWSTTIANGQFDPAVTPRIVHPLTNFSTNNAPVPQTGSINAQSEEPGFPLLTCANPVLVQVVNGIGPDYIISHIRPSRDIVPIGQSLVVEVRVTNIGNVNVTNVTTTTMYGANCTASGLDEGRPTPGLAVGETSPLLSYTCTCGSYGLKRAVAEANYPRSIYEYDYANNQGLAVFYCGNTYAPVCADYV